ncbi:MAG: hypothetical protein WBX27_03080, partial [Specibacter sp.]
MDRAINKWLILAFAIPMPVGHLVLGLANINKASPAWPYLLAMVITVLVIAVLCWRSREHTLPLPAAWAVVAGVVVTDALVTSVLPTGIHPGYGAWHCGAIQMLLVALTFRNRLKMAWLGMGLFAVLDFTMSMHHRLSVQDGLAMVVTPIMWMVIATAVKVMLDRSRTTIDMYKSHHAEAALRLAREHALGLYRDQWILELELATRPALEMIASKDLGEAERTELSLLEAELRDQIRGRVLATPDVMQAARRARKRGVKVDILDDRKRALPDGTFDEAVAQLVHVLDQAQ